MPRFLAPKKSTQHRVAAIALYRALLSRCSTANLSDEPRTALRNTIRQKFRKNAKLQGAYQISVAFRAGYETLDHLDASSTGNTTSTTFLNTYISTLPAGLKRPPPIYPPSAPKPTPRTKHPLDCLPPAQSVLAVRPHREASLTGIRHVPILSSANGIPFLRLTKPQPPSLSRIIRTRLNLMNDLFHDRVVLENYDMPLAQQEDDWDEILEREHGVTMEEVGVGGGEGKWVDAVSMASEKNHRRWDYERWKSSTITKKMQDLVDREMELARAEGREVVRGRVKRWKQNRRVAT